MSITQKLVLSFLILALVPVLMIGMIFYTGSSSAFKQQIAHQLEALATIQKNRTLSAINLNQERVVDLTSRLGVQTPLDEYNRLHKASDQVLLNQQLQNARSRIKSFRDLSILDPNGKVVASTKSSRIGTNQSTMDFFTNGKQRVDVTNHFFTDGQGQAGLYLVGPILFQNKLIGEAVIESNIVDSLTYAQDYTGLGATGQTVLATKDSEGNALFLTPLRDDPQAALHLRIDKSHTQEPINRALSGQDVTLVSAVDYRHHTVLAATRHIDGTNWGLDVKIDEAEAYAPLYQLRDTFLLLVFVILVIVVMVALFAARAITDPILTLSQAAKRMSRGDLSQRVTIATKDELGDLATSFNNMATGLEKLDKMKSEFISLSSHQLRTPATAVKGFISMLLDGYAGRLSTKQRELLNAAYQENERQVRLVTDMLTVAYADTDKMMLSKSSVDLVQVVYAVVAQQMPLLKAHCQKVVVHKPSSKLMMTTDPEKIHMVVENLISNASKYAPDNTKISVSLQRTGDRVVIEVTDQGFGIGKKDLGKLFQKFSRISNPNTVQAQGSGLGLYLIKKIVDLHQGTIKVHSSPGKGTTFTIQLPKELGRTA